MKSVVSFSSSLYSLPKCWIDFFDHEIFQLVVSNKAAGISMSVSFLPSQRHTSGAAGGTVSRQRVVLLRYN
jgi:hypothetical protein